MNNNTHEVYILFREIYVKQYKKLLRIKVRDLGISGVVGF
jgi:hypothetical protein